MSGYYCDLEGPTSQLSLCGAAVHIILLYTIYGRNRDYKRQLNAVETQQEAFPDISWRKGPGMQAENRGIFRRENCIMLTHDKPLRTRVLEDHIIDELRVRILCIVKAGW